MGAEEISCDDGNVWERIGCILSYGGDIQDILINYILILLNFLYCTHIITLEYDDIIVIDNNNNNNNQQQQQRYDIFSFIFVIVFQIGLCLMVGCSGVSIIWCSMCGWIMNERRSLVLFDVADDNVDNTSPTTTAVEEDEDDGNDENDSLLLLFSSRRSFIEKMKYYGQVVIFLDVMVILYYFVVSETITTIAHICALVLGAILSKLGAKLSVEEEGSQRNNNTNNVDGRSPSSQRLISTTT